MALSTHGSRPSRRPRLAARSGFTLVELMIALLAGSIAVIAVYYLSGVSSRAYQDQMRVAETQQSLRSAMEQLRRDIARAGYLGTPNSSTLAPDCGGTMGGSDVAPRQVRALQITHNGSPAASAPVAQLLGLTAGVNQTRADVLRLWGNYATADAYLTDPTATTPTVIRFQQQSESFRRSFFDPTAGNGAAEYRAARFEEVFAQGRMLRVEQNGRFFFRDIQSSDGIAGTVTLKQALPGCFEPTNWTAVAPLSRIRYQVEPDNADELARLNLVPQDSEAAAGPPLPGRRRTLLVRREEIDETGAIAPFSSRVVLDYAVEFAVDAIVNGGAYAADPVPAWVYSTHADVTTQSTNTPENFRSLIVTLSSRSTDAAPQPEVATQPSQRFARARFNQAGLLDSPLPIFRVVDPTEGYQNIAMDARVRTMRSEILLQNL